MGVRSVFDIVFEIFRVFFVIGRFLANEANEVVFVSRFRESFRVGLVVSRIMRF